MFGNSYRTSLIKTETPSVGTLPFHSRKPLPDIANITNISFFLLLPLYIELNIQ